LTFLQNTRLAWAAFKPQPHDWPFLIAAGYRFRYGDDFYGWRERQERRERRRERRDYYWRERGDRY